MLLHQKDFYEEPRFHASIAWALLDRPLEQSEKPSRQSDLTAKPMPRALQKFPPDLLQQLTKEFGEVLASKSGAFEVNNVKVKIGKDIFSWALSG